MGVHPDPAHTPMLELRQRQWERRAQAGWAARPGAPCAASGASKESGLCLCAGDLTCQRLGWRVPQKHQAVLEALWPSSPSDTTRSGEGPLLGCELWRTPWI